MEHRCSFPCSQEPTTYFCPQGNSVHTKILIPYDSFIAYFPYLKKMEGSLCDRLAACVSPLGQKAGILEPEETAIIRQQLSKHVPTATNAHATIK
jgi:hypothetical protein